LQLKFEVSLTLKKWIFLLFLALFSAQTFAAKDVVWKNLATMNCADIEGQAKVYLINKIPELKGVEFKVVQINAELHTSGPTLEITFVHANSLKPMHENKTLGGPGAVVGIDYYMEFLRVNFSLNGQPESYHYQEVLLGKTEEESKKMFERHFEFFQGSACAI
jgi:hypothetical protein